MALRLHFRPAVEIACVRSSLTQAQDPKIIPNSMPPGAT